MSALLSRVVSRGWILAGVMAVGCGGETPTIPEHVEADGVAMTAQGGANPRVYEVTGGGSAHHANGIVQNVRVNATQWADGTVEGEWSFHSRNPDGRTTLPFDLDLEIVAEVDCLAIDGGLAWMSGSLTHIKKATTPGPFPFQVGDPFVAQVRDRHADPGLGDGFFGPAAVWGTADCADKPAAPPLPPSSKINGGFTIHVR